MHYCIYPTECTVLYKFEFDQYNMMNGLHLPSELKTLDT